MPLRERYAARDRERDAVRGWRRSWGIRAAGQQVPRGPSCWGWLSVAFSGEGQCYREGRVVFLDQNSN